MGESTINVAKSGCVPEPALLIVGLRYVPYPNPPTGGTKVSWILSPMTFVTPTNVPTMSNCVSTLREPPMTCGPAFTSVKLPVGDRPIRSTFSGRNESATPATDDLNRTSGVAPANASRWSRGVPVPVESMRTSVLPDPENRTRSALRRLVAPKTRLLSIFRIPAALRCRMVSRAEAPPAPQESFPNSSTLNLELASPATLTSHALDATPPTALVIAPLEFNCQLTIEVLP